MYKIYFAARLDRRAELQICAAELRFARVGYCVASWVFRQDHIELGRAGYDSAQGKFDASVDLADIEASDMVICFTEVPEIGYTKGGRHVELGYALALKKRIYIVGPAENAFYLEHQRYTWAAFLQMLKTLQATTVR